MNCVDYLQGDINNIEDIFSKDHEVCIKQYGKGKGPYPHDYMHELNIANKLDAYCISRYQQFIGTLRWAIELGHIYINTEASCIYQQLYHHDRNN